MYLNDDCNMLLLRTNKSEIDPSFMQYNTVTRFTAGGIPIARRTGRSWVYVFFQDSPDNMDRLLDGVRSLLLI